MSISEQSAGTYDCRIALSCNNIMVYGEGSSGYGNCNIGTDGRATFEDASWTDGDPAVRFEFAPGRPATARAEGNGWALEMAAQVDTVDAAVAAATARDRERAQAAEREREARREAARADIQAALAGLAELQGALTDRTTYDANWFLETESTAGQLMRRGLDATVPAGDEGRAAADDIYAAFDAVQALRLRRTRELIQPYGVALIARARQLTWRDGASAVAATMEEMRLTQAAAAGVGLQPPPAGQPGAVDLLGENGLGPWVRRLTILAGEIDDISLHLNRWCDIYPERLRYVRESLPRTSGRERQQLQEDLAVIQADIRDSETYLRQHGVSATRASCEARPPEPARH